MAMFEAKPQKKNTTFFMLQNNKQQDESTTVTNNVRWSDIPLERVPLSQQGLNRMPNSLFFFNNVILFRSHVSHSVSG
jgi:hypothetical protein